LGRIDAILFTVMKIKQQYQVKVWTVFATFIKTLLAAHLLGHYCGSCEHGNKILSTITGREFLGWLHGVS
jgi:hypothetical protein